MTKISICYFGMTRSTKLVYQTHTTNLHNILKNNNIEFDIFMHTWKTKNDENVIWEKSCDVMVDYNEYVLLNPNFYKIENQEDFINSINFENYFDKNIYDVYGGDSHREWRPQLIMNHLCALESQKRVYNMVSESNNTYDFILFIRPDVKILNIFDVTCLTNKFDIIIPSYDHHEGLNDRFAILPFNSAEKYATRIDEIIEFRKNNGRIVSEKYVKYIVQKYYPNFKCINFIMQIIRPDGSF